MGRLAKFEATMCVGREWCTGRETSKGKQVCVLEGEGVGGNELAKRASKEGRGVCEKPVG